MSEFIAGWLCGAVLQMVLDWLWKRWKRRTAPVITDPAAALADEERLQWIVARYHYRNGKSQPDGSMGEIKITPGEFLLALRAAYDFAAHHGKENA